MRLYCVRHGESVYNSAGRIQGQLDVPLSDFGRRQGAAIAEALRAAPVDAVYSSPLRRALETAEIITHRIPAPLHTDPRLQEINAGIFQGRRREELVDLCPGELARWMSGEPEFVIPGGESRADLTRRGCAAFRDIAASGHQHAVIVAHGRLLVVTLKALIGLATSEATPTLENGSITTLVADPDGHWELVAFNDVTHLQGVGLAGAGDL